jgi:hypothetical protein
MRSRSADPLWCETACVSSFLERKEQVELGKGDPSYPSLLHVSMARRRKLDSISQEDELGSCASKFATEAGGGQQLTMPQLILSMPDLHVNRAPTYNWDHPRWK